MKRADDPLLRPLQIGNLRLKNRVMSAAHEPFYSEDGLPKKRYRLYHEQKAAGGIALTMIGGSAVVSPDSPPAFGNLQAFRDEIVKWFAELADGVHNRGAKVICQLTHLGRRGTAASGDWLALVAPSPLREAAHRSFPKEIEGWDLRRIARDFAAAAARCRAGGLDGIEILFSGHLLDSFWSPLTNRRDDEYDCRPQNRLRFSFEVLRAVRRAVGDDCIVGARVVGDENCLGGLSAADGAAIARELSASGLVDFFNVNRGALHNNYHLSRMIPNLGGPLAPHLECAAAIKRVVSQPVFHSARVIDAATARYAVGEGKVDMIGMTRAHIADPMIVVKIERGEEGRIRPCVGAGYCLDRIYENGEALCIHNAATGREESMPHEIAAAAMKKRVVIVGAGPAGLEAARVCAARGHSVVLFEAQARAGGQIRLAASVSRRRDLIGIVEWRLAELARFGVDIRFERYADADAIRAESPDIVIVASGGLPNASFLREGEDLAVSGWDVLSGAVAARAGLAASAGRTLLYDDNGAHPGFAAAECLLAQGATLTFATPESALAPDIGGTNQPPYFAAFAERGVEIVLNTRLVGLRRAAGESQITATLQNEYGGAPTPRVFDRVVVEGGTLPAADEYFALREESTNGGEVDYEALLAGRAQSIRSNPSGRFQLFRIGDAVASRNIHAAIYDALRLAKDL